MKQLININEDITDLYKKFKNKELRKEEILPYNLNKIKPLDFGLSFLIGSDILRDDNKTFFSIDEIKDINMGEWRLPTDQEIQEFNRKYLYIGNAGHYEIKTKYVENPFGVKIKEKYIHIEHGDNKLDLPMSGWSVGNIVEHNNEALCLFCDSSSTFWTNNDYSFFWWDEEHDDCYTLRPKQKNIILLVKDK